MLFVSYHNISPTSRPCWGEKKKKAALVEVSWILGLSLGNSKEPTTDTLLSKLYLSLKGNTWMKTRTGYCILLYKRVCN